MDSMASDRDKFLPCSWSSRSEGRFGVLVLWYESEEIARRDAGAPEVEEEKNIGMYALTRAVGHYLISLKTGVEDGQCGKDKLSQLMDIAVSRVGGLAN